MDDPEPLRFTDILTMGASVASYLASPDVSPQHMLDGIDVLRGKTKLEDLGRMRSPLMRLPPSRYGGVEPAVRELVQRWFARLNNDPSAELDDDAVGHLREELQALPPSLSDSQ